MKKKWLSCGCCGIDFRVWERYVGQDHGSGICKHCQKLIREKNILESVIFYTKFEDKKNL